MGGDLPLSLSILSSPDFGVAIALGLASVVIFGHAIVFLDDMLGYIQQPDIRFNAVF